MGWLLVGAAVVLWGTNARTARRTVSRARDTHAALHGPLAYGRRRVRRAVWRAMW